MSEHSKHLKRCFELARLGESYTAPNPNVGAVIVVDDLQIAEGFHQKAGEAHAEVQAIKDLESKCSEEELAKIYPQASIYINLVPCSHHGKTPPCCDLIIKKGFKRVIYSSDDPNPLVDTAASKLKEAGIEVVTPEDLNLEIVEESNWINRAFFKWIKTGKSYVTLKVASRADGSTETRDGEDRWVTNEYSRKEVHRMRSANDLLVTGAQSIRIDDSSLNVRHLASELDLAETKNPDIIVLYRKQSLDTEKYKIFKLDPSRKVMQATGEDLGIAIQAFEAFGYKRIMIETGAKLSQAFLEAGLVDEVVHFEALDNRSLIQASDEILKRYSGFVIKQSNELESDISLNLVKAD